MKTFNIYYAKSLREYCTQFDGVKVLRSTFKDTHVHLMRIDAEDLNDVYDKLNHWSNNELIKNKGLSHTSMSMGDVIEDVEASTFHVVDARGFCKLTGEVN